MIAFLETSSWVRGPRSGWLLAIGLALGCANPAPRQTTNAPVPRSTPGGERSVEEAHAEDDASGESHPVVVLPLQQLRTHHIVVPVTLGDHGPVDFILDTGASMSVITPETRDAVGIAPDAGMKVRGKGAGGDVSDTRLVVLEQLEIGMRAYEQHTVAVMDLSHLESKLEQPIGGVLGRNFLEKHVVMVDFPGDELRLHPSGAVETGTIDVSDMTVIEYGAFAAGGLIRIEVRLDDAEPMSAVLDLGAGRTVMNWKAAKLAGVGPDTKGLKKSKEPILGADSTPIQAAYHRFEQLGLATLSFPEPEILLADLPVFETLGLADEPAMIFGIDMFRGRALVLDYGDRTIYVSEPRSASAEPEGR